MIPRRKWSRINLFASHQPRDALRYFFAFCLDGDVEAFGGGLTSAASTPNGVSSASRVMPISKTGTIAVGAKDELFKLILAAWMPNLRKMHQNPS